MVNWSLEHDVNSVDWAVKLQLKQQQQQQQQKNKKKKKKKKKTTTKKQTVELQFHIGTLVHHNLLVTLLEGSKPKTVFTKQPCYIQRKIH